MIPDHVVDEVRTRADIVEIVGEHIPLKKAGKEYRALCPFHQEKTPSFYVIPNKQFYNCFGCGESGDVFTFLMKRLGLDFQDAVRALATRYGVTVPETHSVRAEDEHKELREALAFAADFYQRMLWEDPRGERVRAYLEQRGVERAAAEKFMLGAAPDEWRALRDAAAKHDITDEVLLEAGLIKVSEREDSQHEPYDRFRDRLIFPIPDVGGRVVAFGGRILGKAKEGVPKYLNSPETPVYHKGSLLYGIAWARGAIRREGKALLVEGNMDFVSLAGRGVENVVAGLGTALTEDQANLIARYAKTAVLIYDSDAAGMRATFKSGDALLRAGVHPLVATLPTGEDPDSLVRKGGPQALRPFVEDAIDVLDRKLQILEERGYFGDIDGIRQGLDRLLPTLRAATDPALRDIYVSRVASKTGVRRETLEHELTPGRPYGDRDLAPREVPVQPPRRAGGGAQGQKRDREWENVRLLLTLMLKDPDRVAQAAAEIAADQLRDPVHREIFESLLAGAAATAAGTASGDSAAARPALSAEAAELAGELVRDPVDLSEGDRIFQDAVADIRVGALLLRADELNRLIEIARGEEQERLLREKTEVALQLAALGHKEARLGSKVSPRHRRHRRAPSSERGERHGPPTPER